MRTLHTQALACGIAWGRLKAAGAHPESPREGMRVKHERETRIYVVTAIAGLILLYLFILSLPHL